MWVPKLEVCAACLLQKGYAVFNLSWQLAISKGSLDANFPIWSGYWFGRVWSRLESLKTALGLSSRDENGAESILI